MVTEFHKFYKDKRFYIPILVLLCFELILQTGVYKPYLKKNSYAANINRITDHVIAQKKHHDPDILILGTSVAYQGLSPRILQEKLTPLGLKIQSIAIPGSELIVQDLATQKVLRELQKVKLLIYVGEITMPWVAQENLGLPTLAMIGEFEKSIFWNLPKEYNYNVLFEDYVYLFSKSIAYRRDFRDFFTDPAKRFKHISRSKKHPNLNFYDFENNHTEKMSSYKITSLEDCIEKTKEWYSPPYPENSNEDHKKAIFDTCDLASKTTTEAQRTSKTKLYFERLSKLYKHYQNKNIKILNIFAPYSYTMKHLGGKQRLQVWQEELEKILGQENVHIADFQDIFQNEDSNEYCYDTIHLNKQGMERFSNVLGNYLLNYLKKNPL